MAMVSHAQTIQAHQQDFGQMVNIFKMGQRWVVKAYVSIANYSLRTR